MPKVRPHGYGLLLSPTGHPILAATRMTWPQRMKQLVLSTAEACPEGQLSKQADRCGPRTELRASPYLTSLEDLCLIAHIGRMLS